MDELLVIEEEKEVAIQKAPPGKIHVIKSRRSMQYYLRENPGIQSGTYISKEKKATIQRYLQKSYDEKVLRTVLKEIKNIQSFLKHSDNIQHDIREIYSSNPDEIKSMLNPIDCSDEDYIRLWQEVPFEGNPIPISTIEYKTIKGESVRSKSELIIANSLLQHGIPYKYECPVVLWNGAVVYPDFTVLDVKRRKVVYWEHRGMMDDREYVKNSVKKLKEYSNSGIIIGDNLVITEEALGCAIGTNEIENIIQTVFGK